jgi:hypothetical protein
MDDLRSALLRFHHIGKRDRMGLRHIAAHD